MNASVKGKTCEDNRNPTRSGEGVGCIFVFRARVMTCTACMTSLGCCGALVTKGRGENC